MSSAQGNNKATNGWGSNASSASRGGNNKKTSSSQGKSQVYNNDWERHYDEEELRRLQTKYKSLNPIDADDSDDEREMNRLMEKLKKAKKTKKAEAPPHRNPVDYDEDGLM